MVGSEAMRVVSPPTTAAGDPHAHALQAPQQQLQPAAGMHAALPASRARATTGCHIRRSRGWCLASRQMELGSLRPVGWAHDRKAPALT